MSKDSVALIGLCWEDVIKGKTAVIDKMDNVWVLNDWYQFFRWLKRPSKIFNIHEHPFTHPSPERFTGDWKKEYNDTGAEVVVFNDIEGVNNQRMLEWEELERIFPRKAYQCTLVCMIYLAILEDFKEIYLFGFLLDGEAEYSRELVPVQLAIKEARKRGIVVHNPNEDAWNKRVDVKTVDWAHIREAPKYYMFKFFPGVDVSVIDPKK